MENVTTSAAPYHVDLGTWPAEASFRDSMEEGGGRAWWWGGGGGRLAAMSLRTCTKGCSDALIVIGTANKFAHAPGCKYAGSAGCFKTKLIVARQYPGKFQPHARAN